MQRLTTQQVISFFDALTDKMPEHAESLRELDAQLGDGDLGITVTLGMQGIKEGLAELVGEDAGTVIARSGMSFNRAAASTFGVIFASALMSAGKQVKGKDEITVADLSDMFEAAAAGVAARGGAQVGEKTVLDVLTPMAEALREAADTDVSLVEAVHSAQRRCHEALEATKEMEGKHGRAGWLRAKSVGVPDPGATAICLMMDCLREFVEQGGAVAEGSGSPREPQGGA